ncbi:amino acid ABC transporter permease [Oceanobacter sp. 3_MG-2023]|jgi:general L-amino acid transport system permease protein|uniref:amino acid ABC transporter permease n=1 Tax=Oceanobacter sp. 3_MG-2023 TaxID=3062622 RepID=UPI00273773FF|nr:amino acid ABC transporter permease [Oceanobacter sp. 3_MG-2023]MDP2505187.1 amino acid ABC transporter permease [Oceanobacter sp. 3_MG-2023]
MSHPVVPSDTTTPTGGRIFHPKAAEPAPVTVVGKQAWLKNNLFSSPLNSAITLVLLALLGSFIPALADWLFISAHISGQTQDACTGDGACWVFIKVWIQPLMYGNYPDASLWRVNLSLILLGAVLSSPYWLPPKLRNKVDIMLLLAFPFIAIIILDGRLLGLEYVSTAYWGGFSLNLFLASASIILGMPLGFLWALGRRSNMPMARSICVVLIEFFRGVPVLALFFMGSVMLPLFFPEGTNVDKLLRVWIVLTLFMAGYMAEVYRGGFQAIPSGQYEASAAIGLSYWQTTLLVILPQVIKVSMPNILATSVMLFKNTTFLMIIGIFEILSTAQNALTNSNWLGGFSTEAYLFVAVIYWICCFSMSMVATRIERKLDTSHKS